VLYYSIFNTETLPQYTAVINKVVKLVRNVSFLSSVSSKVRSYMFLSLMGPYSWFPEQ